MQIILLVYSVVYYITGMCNSIHSGVAYMYHKRKLWFVPGIPG